MLIKKRKEFDKPLTLIPVQESLYAGSLHNSQSILSKLVKLDRGTTMEQVISVVEQLTNRHEALRARFVSQDGKVTQDITSEASHSLCEKAFIAENTIISQIPGYDQLNNPAREEAIIAWSFAYRFELDAPPLFRFSLMESIDGEKYLLWFIHHIICDGVSNRIVIDKISSELASSNRPERSSRANTDVSNIQFFDYVHWMHEENTTRNLFAINAQKTADKYKNYYATACFPRRSGGQEEDDRVFVARFPLILDDAPSWLSQAAIGENALLLAGLILLLYDNQQRPEVVLTSLFSNRISPQLTDIVGCLAGSVRLRLMINTDQSIKDFFTALQLELVTGSLESMADSRRIMEIHQSVIGDEPIHQSQMTLFSYDYFADMTATEEQSLGREDTHAIEHAENPDIAPGFFLRVKGAQGRYVGAISYCRLHFSPQVINALVHRYRELLENILRSDIQAPLSEALSR